MFVLYKQKLHDNFVTMQLFFNNTASRGSFYGQCPICDASELRILD